MRTFQYSWASNATSALNCARSVRSARTARKLASGIRLLTGWTTTSTCRSAGTDLPSRPSGKIRNVPTPTSGSVQTETRYGPTILSTITGYGGPSCAPTGDEVQRTIAAVNKKQRHIGATPKLTPASQFPTILNTRLLQHSLTALSTNADAKSTVANR